MQKQSTRITYSTEYLSCSESSIRTALVINLSPVRIYGIRKCLLLALYVGLDIAETYA